MKAAPLNAIAIKHPGRVGHMTPSPAALKRSSSSLYRRHSSRRLRVRRVTTRETLAGIAESPVAHQRSQACQLHPALVWSCSASLLISVCARDGGVPVISQLSSLLQKDMTTQGQRGSRKFHIPGGCSANLPHHWM